MFSDRFSLKTFVVLHSVEKVSNSCVTNQKEEEEREFLLSRFRIRSERSRERNFDMTGYFSRRTSACSKSLELVSLKIVSPVTSSHQTNYLI